MQQADYLHRDIYTSISVIIYIAIFSCNFQYCNKTQNKLLDALPYFFYFCTTNAEAFAVFK